MLASVEVRGQLKGVSSLLPPWGFQTQVIRLSSKSCYPWAAGQCCLAILLLLLSLSSSSSSLLFYPVVHYSATPDYFSITYENGVQRFSSSAFYPTMISWGTLCVLSQDWRQRKQTRPGLAELVVWWREMKWLDKIVMSLAQLWRRQAGDHQRAMVWVLGFHGQT